MSPRCPIASTWWAPAPTYWNRMFARWRPTRPSPASPPTSLRSRARSLTPSVALYGRIGVRTAQHIAEIGILPELWLGVAYEIIFVIVGFSVTIQGELAGLKVSKVKKVIDQFEEYMGCLTHHQEVSMLLRPQRGVEHQLGHANDAI